VLIGSVSGQGAWGWHPHLVLWSTVIAVGAAVALLHGRLHRAGDPLTRWPRARALRFVAALVVTLVVMGWPLGDLAAHWSLSALVLQRSVLVLAVAPLLLSGLPDHVIAWATHPAPVDALLLRVCRPPAAVVVVTVLLVGSMLPALVAAQSNSVAARGLEAMVVVLAGVILWLPIIGRVPGIARPRPMIRAVYLVAQAVVPVFLSFVFILATRPLYPALAHSDTVIGLTSLNDQQVAGFVSKLSFLITLLAVSGVILNRAPDTDEDLGPEDPLVLADIERHFERADRRGRPVASDAPMPPNDGIEGGDDLASDVPGDGDLGSDRDSSTG
jgi:putative membrane protein